MKKVTKQNILENSTLLFLFLFPLFSTIFFYNHLTTLFMLVVTFILLLFTLIFIKPSRSKCKYLFIYYIVSLIYYLLNIFHNHSFTSLVPGDFNYNIVKEGLTILKLVTPITLLYILYYQKIPYKKYMFVIKAWCLFICLSIIITNIFGLSLSSYKDGLITHNIFTWNKGYYYQDIASKGMFMYANQISVFTLIILIPLLYNYLTCSKKDIIYILLITVTNLMLGTRVSSLGGLLTLICYLLFYIAFSIYNKEKIKKRTFLLLIPLALWFILLPISPYSSRHSELNREALKEESVTTSVNVIDAKTLDTKTQYVYEHYNKDYLPSDFFENKYPIKYDEEFWYDYVLNNKPEEMTYRHTEKSIIKRVVEINNKKSDKLLGISNTRIQNIVNLEKDFVLQYYAFGLVGMLVLLFVYFALSIYSIYNFFKKQSMYAFTFSTVILLFCFASYLTGNILNSLNIALPFIFISSMIFRKEDDIRE